MTPSTSRIPRIHVAKSGKSICMTTWNRSAEGSGAAGAGTPGSSHRFVLEVL